MNQKNLTYVDYLNIYYKIGIPLELKSDRNSLFLGLLYKANTLRRNGSFPKEFTLTNHEAQSLSGLLNLRSFHRIRKSLTEYQKDGIWIVKYTAPQHSSKCGKYALNLALLESYRNLSDKMDIQNDIQSDIQTSTQNDTQTVHLLRTEENRKNIYMQSDKWESVRILINRWCPSVLHNLNDADIQMLNEIMEYSYDMIESVILHAGNEHIGYRKFLKYVIGGLQNFDYLYKKDKNATKDKPDLNPNAMYDATTEEIKKFDPNYLTPAERRAKGIPDVKRNLPKWEPEE